MHLSTKNTKILLRERRTAGEHTHGFFALKFMATWLIPANIRHLKLYWIREKGARRNALLLLKPSRIHAQSFWEQSQLSQEQFQWKALYIETDESGSARWNSGCRWTTSPSWRRSSLRLLIRDAISVIADTETILQSRRSPLSAAASGELRHPMTHLLWRNAR